MKWPLLHRFDILILLFIRSSYCRVMFGAVPRSSALPKDCPTPIIQWFSILWRFPGGGKIIMNGYVFKRGGQHSEFGWTTRRRQNDVNWIQLVAGNKFTETISRIQAWSFAGARDYVMNCILWPCDCTSTNIAQYWWRSEQLQPYKAMKYQTPLHYDQWRTQEFFQGRRVRPGILSRCSTNSVEDRGQRERGSGGGSPLVRGSTQFANEWNPYSD
jgi:hypothetical protein